MKFQRFMIGPLNQGLQTDIKPWLLPDQAYAQLRNAYVWRDRIRKRVGSRLLNGSVDADVAQLYSRLRIQVGTVAAPTATPANIAVGQNFSVGDEIYTVYQNGAMYSNTVGATGNATVGGTAFTINSLEPGATEIYWYPALPVMGFTNLETDDINDEPLYAFDTTFAYTYVNDAWQRVGTATWTGNNTNFFWSTNYRGTNADDTVLFTSNFRNTGTVGTSDPIRYLSGGTWTNYTPRFSNANAAYKIYTARIILPYKDRLLLLNTAETTDGTTLDQFPNRLRYSQNGSPFDTSAFYDDIAGRGGYLDAPTKEAIITAEFLRDRLIVYFERSTWEIAYTGNDILPFQWQQINTELGAESTFSVVPFDTVVLGVGNVGIHQCSGSSVDRIDSKIPDEVFKISNDNEGVFRVQGIRDYYVEMVYWTFPSQDSPFGPYPDRILVYNYKTGSWAFNDDSITAFGYYQQQDDITWNSLNTTWEEADFAWNSGTTQAKFRQIVAGNQQGFTFIVDSTVTKNAPALTITNITVSGIEVTITSYSHNLRESDYVYIQSAGGITELNDQIWQVVEVVDSDTFIVEYTAGIVANYTGGGTIARVSQIDILTKQYNFYVKEGRNAYVPQVDFLVDRTANGEIAVDFYTSYGELSLTQEGTLTGSLLGTYQLETTPYTLIPYEAQQSQLWHPIYIQGEGESVQLRIYLDEEQLSTPSIAFSDFVLNAFTVYAVPTSSRLQ